MDIWLSNNIIIIHCSDGKLALRDNVGTQTILKDKMFKGERMNKKSDNVYTLNLQYKYATTNIQEYLCLDRTKSQVLQLKDLY